MSRSQIIIHSITAAIITITMLESVENVCAKTENAPAGASPSPLLLPPVPLLLSLLVPVPLLLLSSGFSSRGNVVSYYMNNMMIG